MKENSNTGSERQYYLVAYNINTLKAFQKYKGKLNYVVPTNIPVNIIDIQFELAGAKC